MEFVNQGKFHSESIYNLKHSLMFSYKADKTAGWRAITVFDRVLRFYRTFDVIAALPAIVASVFMKFDGFQDSQTTAVAQIAVVLLASSVVKSVIAITLAKMSPAIEIVFIILHIHTHNTSGLPVTLRIERELQCYQEELRRLEEQNRRQLEVNQESSSGKKN